MQIFFFGEFVVCEIDSIINLKTMPLIEKKQDPNSIKLCTDIEIQPI